MDSSNASSPVGAGSPQEQRLAQAIQNSIIRRTSSQPSPLYPFQCIQLTAGSSQVFDFTTENQPYSLYAPFTNLKVVNSSQQPIYVYFGEFGSVYDLVPANFTQVYNKTDMGGGVSTLKIVNQGSGTITAGQVFITAYKEGTTAEDAVQGVQNFFNRDLNLNPSKYARWNRFRGLI